MNAPSLAAAFAGGLLSFLSPCVLPLVPIYLSFVSGESAREISGGKASRFLLASRTVFFVGGFSVVFVLLALLIGSGARLLGAGIVVSRVAGIVVLVLAANVLLDFIPFLRAARVMPAPRNTPARNGLPGPARATLLGMAFAAGWTPCVGPILSSILLLAGTQADPARAAGLLAAYSIGLALPFFLASLFLDRSRAILYFFQRHARATKIASAALLALVGVLMLTGGLTGIASGALRAGYALADFAENGPAWIRPFAGLLSRWLSFTGA